MSSDSVYAREATLSSDDESEDTSSSIINRPTSRAGSLASGRGSRSRSRKKRVGQYIIGETIGKGSFGTVKVGTHCDTGERVALKFLSKKQVRDISEVERLFRESAILTSLKCEHIIRLYEVIDDVAHIVMVMELAQGGELLDVIKARHALPEREACKVFSEIVAGVEYCHRKNVIHRDLKLENILMVNQTVKIADFGLSNTAILGRSELGTACGTPSYLAPEQINREAGQHIGAPADLWSMGVILYAMVAGFLPFQARSTPALFKKILNLEFTYPDYFSEELRDLIGRMLTPDPESRATISEVKSHPWYMMELSDLADASTRQVSEDAVKQAREKVSEKAAQAKASTRTKAPAASKPKLKRADSAKLPPLPSVPTTTTSTSIAKRDTAPSPTSRSMRGSGGSVSSVRSGASATGQFKLRQQQQQGSGASSRASSIDSTASVKSSPTPSWKSSSLTPSSRLPDFEFDDDDEAPSGTSSGNNNNNNAILLPSVAETVRTRSRLHSTGHSGKHLTSDSDLPSTLSTK